MWEIVAYQYKITSIVLTYIMEHFLQLYSKVNPNFNELYPKFFDVSETLGFLFLATFLFSLFIFWLWRLIAKIFKFQVYDAEKYRVILIFNIFYIVPFIYWFIWGRFKIINVFLLFIWSWAYYAFKWIFSNPDAVINYFS